MANRLALVVDDSKTARVTLRRMLEQHNLEVDTLESAPEAIDYLTSHTPDVIFMDHMMPDMDGFEAVEAIKGNPDTATIPIMMYTSKEGDLYVSQARALGAMGILPKHVEPAELFEVLNSLGLARERRSQSEHKSGVVLLEDVPEVALSAVPGDIRDIAYEAAEAVGGHESANHRNGEGQLAEILSELHSMRSELHALSTDRGLISGLTNKPLVQGLLFLVMLGALVWMYSTQLNTRQELQTVKQRNIELTAAQQGQQASDAIQASLLDQLNNQETSARLQSQQLFSSIAWALNLGSAYDMQQVAFSDQRLSMVQGLLTRLSALGFAGTVQLESHVGDFCLAGDEVNGYRIANDGRMAVDCNLIGHPQYQLPNLGERQSIGFANFMASSPLVNDTGIRIDLVNYQNSRPRLTYPPVDPGVSAVDWNTIAAANHRIEVTLIPDLIEQ